MKNLPLTKIFFLHVVIGAIIKTFFQRGLLAGAVLLFLTFLMNFIASYITPFYLLNSLLQIYFWAGSLFVILFHGYSDFMVKS